MSAFTVTPLRPSAEPESDVVISGAKPPLVDEGEYDLQFLHHETQRLYGGKVPKVALWFRVVTPGPFCGVVLPRYYNVRAISGKPRKGGKFEVGWHSELVRECAQVLGLSVGVFETPEVRRNRVSFADYAAAVIVGRVRTVNTTWKQKARPESLQYSVVEELIRISGSGKAQGCGSSSGRAEA